MQHSVARAGSRGYDGRDLDMFKAVLDDILGELDAARSPLVRHEQRHLTRVRLAALIFRFADGGERDPARLKRRAKRLLVEDGPVAQRAAV